MASRPEDFENYIRFLSILREEFEAEAAHTGREQLLLTAAVGVGKSTVDESYNIPAMNEKLDLISLMTYDMAGAWNPTTGFNAPLRATSTDVSVYGYPLSVEWAVDYWLNAGASPDKLVLGLGPYGRGWTLAGAGLPGQNQPANSPGAGPSAAGPMTRFAGYMSYVEIQQMINAGEATRYWDAERLVPYIISTDGTQWIGYDDPESLSLKTDFLMAKGLRGAMFWALELDDSLGDLGEGKYPCISTVKSVLTGYRSNITSSSDPQSTTTVTTDLSSTLPTQSPTSTDFPTTSPSTSSTTTSPTTTPLSSPTSLPSSTLTSFPSTSPSSTPTTLLSTTPSLTTTTEVTSTVPTSTEIDSTISTTTTESLTTIVPTQSPTAEVLSNMPSVTTTTEIDSTIQTSEVSSTQASTTTTVQDCEVFKAVGETATDEWCQETCTFNGGDFCPESHCECCVDCDSDSVPIIEISNSSFLQVLTALIVSLFLL